jgi:hypothetical protein
MYTKRTNEYNFGSYRSSITPTLHETQESDSVRFRKTRFIAQIIGTERKTCVLARQDIILQLSSDNFHHELNI